jgi:hypothetical protein
MYQIITPLNISDFVSREYLEGIFKVLVEANKDETKTFGIGYLFLDNVKFIDGSNDEHLAIKYSTENKGDYNDILIIQMVKYDILPDFILDDYNEMKRIMDAGNNVKKFYDWFLDYMKQKYNDITILISLPNELQPVKKDLGVGSVILDVFEKINQTLDAKVILKEIVDKADELNITIYAKPAPRYKHIKDENHRSKITEEYLRGYYSKFDFIDGENGYIVREPKNTIS